MKMLFLIIATGMILNPRIVFDANKPDHILSCSTGWSFHWEGLLNEKGLFGIYSPESIAWTKILTDKKVSPEISKQKRLVKKSFADTCN